MTEQSLRDFLKQLATGTVYAAPVVSTLMAPGLASGQGQGVPPSDKTGMAPFDPPGPPPMAQQRNLPQAPWGKRPPGG
jgi:hypothetical protein